RDVFFSLNIERRTDGTRVTHHESIAVTDDTGDGITAVPIRGGLAQDLSDIKLAADFLRNFNTVHFPAQFVIKSGMSFIEMETNFLQNGLGVGIHHRMLASTTHDLVQLA